MQAPPLPSSTRWLRKRGFVCDSECARANVPRLTHPLPPSLLAAPGPCARGAHKERGSTWQTTTLPGLWPYGRGQWGMTSTPRCPAAGKVEESRTRLRQRQGRGQGHRRATDGRSALHSRTPRPQLLELGARAASDSAGSSQDRTEHALGECARVWALCSCSLCDPAAELRALAGSRSNPSSPRGPRTRRASPISWPRAPARLFPPPQEPGASPPHSSP